MAGGGTAAAATKFGRTLLAEAARGGMGGRRALRSGAAVAEAGGKAVDGSEKGRRRRRGLSDVSERSSRKGRTQEGASD